MLLLHAYCAFLSSSPHSQPTAIPTFSTSQAFLASHQTYCDSDFLHIPSFSRFTPNLLRFRLSPHPKLFSLHTKPTAVANQEDPLSYEKYLLYKYYLKAQPSLTSYLETRTTLRKFSLFHQMLRKGRRHAFQKERLSPLSPPTHFLYTPQNGKETLHFPTLPHFLFSPSGGSQRQPFKWGGRYSHIQPS
jgi:hypothetical protein